MRKRSYLTYLEIDLPDEFPISHFFYVQKYKSANCLHYHNGLEIGLCLDGHGVFFIGNQVCPFAKGDVTIIPKGMPHIAQSPDEQPSIWNYMTVEMEKLGVESHLASNIISDKNLAELVHMIFQELQTQPSRFQEMVKTLLRALFIRISRTADEQTHLCAPAPQLDMILPAITYISQNYNEEIHIQQLATLCNLSITHFRRIFKRGTQHSPLEYLFQVRLKMATVLLKSTTHPIADIAMDVGYPTISSFNRQFKNNYGISPREYRNSLV